MLAGWPPRSVTVSQEIGVVTHKLPHARHLAWTWIWLVVLSLGEAGTQLQHVVTELWANKRVDRQATEAKLTPPGPD